MKILCPRDGAALIQQLPNEKMKHCSKCKGVLLNKSEKVFDLLRALTKEAGEGLNSPASIDCPACKVRMRVLVFHGVEIDLCLNCKSAWLDSGEISEIETQNGSSSNSDHVFGPVTDSIIDQVIYEIIGKILD